MAGSEPVVNLVGEDPQVIGHDINAVNAYIRRRYKLEAGARDITRNEGVVGDLFTVPFNGRPGICAVRGGGGASVPPFCSWVRKHALGASNDCLIHSFLTVTCPNFRALDTPQKLEFADEFRRQLLPVLLRMPENGTGSGVQARLVGEARSGIKLSEETLGVLCISYRVRCLLVQNQHQEMYRAELRTEPPRATVIGPRGSIHVIANNFGAHYEGVATVGGSYVIGDAEAIGLVGVIAQHYPHGDRASAAHIARAQAEYPAEFDQLLRSGFRPEQIAIELMQHGGNVVAVRDAIYAESVAAIAEQRAIRVGQLRSSGMTLAKAEAEAAAAFPSTGGRPVLAKLSSPELIAASADRASARRDASAARVAAPVPPAAVAAPVPAARIAAPVPAAAVAPSTKVLLQEAISEYDKLRKKSGDTRSNKYYENLQTMNFLYKEGTITNEQMFKFMKELLAEVKDAISTLKEAAKPITILNTESKDANANDKASIKKARLIYQKQMLGLENLGFSPIAAANTLIASNGNVLEALRILESTKKGGSGRITRRKNTKRRCRSTGMCRRA